MEDKYRTESLLMKVIILNR